MDYEVVKTSILAWATSSGLQILAIVVVGIVTQTIVSRASRTVLKSVLGKKMASNRSDAGRANRLGTLHQVVTKTSGVIIFLAALLMIFVELGINITPILTGAGIIGIAVGFGAQDMVKNLFHGIFILAEDQYSEGDVVTVAGVTGAVEEFDLRRTILRDLDGTQHHIPNGEISVASNRTKSWSGIHMNIGVGYGTDLAKLRVVVRQVGEALASEHADAVIEAPVLAGVEDFADSAMVVKILGKAQPGQQWNLAREFRQMLKEAFDREGIEIPFPHQVEIPKSA